MTSSVVLTGGKYLLRSGARRGLAAAAAPPLRVRSLRDAALDPGGDPESVAARFLPHSFQDPEADVSLFTLPGDFWKQPCREVAFIRCDAPARRAGGHLRRDGAGARRRRRAARPGRA